MSPLCPKATDRLLACSIPAGYWGEEVKGKLKGKAKGRKGKRRKGKEREGEGRGMERKGGILCSCLHRTWIVQAYSPGGANVHPTGSTLRVMHGCLGPRESAPKPHLDRFRCSAGFTFVPNIQAHRQTDHGTCNMCSLGRHHAMHTMRPLTDTDLLTALYWSMWCNRSAVCVLVFLW